MSISLDSAQEFGPKQLVFMVQGFQFMAGAPREVSEPSIICGLFCWVSFAICAVLDWDRFW